MRVPSPNHCRDVLVFQTQPYSLCRFVKPPLRSALTLNVPCDLWFNISSRVNTV